MIVSAIVAFSENYVIGANNKLLWHLPADLKRFKNLTTNHTIIMGRKTFDSIGKALPNRTNIVITRDKNWKFEGVISVSNFEEALEIAKQNNESEAFVIGGGQIYDQNFQKFDKLYVTKIDKFYEGDTFFPIILENQWEIIESILGVLDEKNTIPHAFVNYIRK